MNPTEIIPCHRAVCVTPDGKEIVTVKSITPLGEVRILDAFGHVRELPCECIKKMLE